MSGTLTLATGPSAEAAEWAPDVRIVYTSQCDIFLAHPGGASSVNLTSDVTACTQQPSLSPTGRYVAYQQYGSPFLETWVLDLATGQRSKLPQSGSGPDFSPTADVIAFGGYVNGVFDLFSIGVDGTGLRNWTNDPGGEDHLNLVPQWSADGESLLYTRAQGTRMCRQNMGGYDDLYHTERLYRVDRQGQTTELAGSDGYSISGGHEGAGVLAYVRTAIPATGVDGYCEETPSGQHELVVNGQVVGPANAFEPSVSSTGDVAYSNGGNVMVVPAGTTTPQVLFPGGSPDWGTAYSQSKVATTTTMKVAAAVTYGSGRQLVATVKAASGTPAGTVRFTVDAKVTDVPLNSGTATVTLPKTLALGAHNVQAEYLGNATYAGSSTAHGFAVKAAAVLQGRLPSLTWSRDTTMQMALTVTTTPAVPASGQLTLKDGAKTLSTAQLRPADGNRLRMRIPLLPVGPHSLKVTFTKSPTVMDASTATAKVRVTR